MRGDCHEVEKRIFRSYCFDLWDPRSCGSHKLEKRALLEVLDILLRQAVNGQPSFCYTSYAYGGSLTHPLHIFANPLEVNPPSPYDQEVVYFAPGVYTVPDILLSSGKTLYIAGGAVVYLQPSGSGSSNPPILVPPFIKTVNSSNVTIRGRGILCGRQALAAGQRAQLIAGNFTQNLQVEGITLREAGDWTPVVSNSNQTTIDNIKILGHFENNDGVVISGSTNAVIKNSFVHNGDDSMEVKAWQPAGNITFDNDIV